MFIIYDMQEFHTYRKLCCGHVLLPQASHYHIQDRFYHGWNCLSNASRERSINPAEWQQRQTAVVSPAPLLLTVYKCVQSIRLQEHGVGQHMPRSSHTTPPPATDWEENYAKLNSNCTLSTCSCHLRRAAGYADTLSLSRTFTHPLSTTWALFQNLVSCLTVYFILAS